MRTMIMILALAIPLSAQSTETDTEVSKDEQQQRMEIIVKESVPQKVVRHLQDAEWRKFQSAHGRAHSRRGEEQSGRVVDKRQKMYKKQQIKNVVRLVVVGGLAYYIGYHQGEEHFNGGMKRRPYFGDRK